MKPSWKGAPEWAQWLAKDESGWWYWFEEMPSLEKPKFGIYEIWWNKGKCEQAGKGGGVYFADSIEERP
jgi:hypothetical protein